MHSDGTVCTRQPALLERCVCSVYTVCEQYITCATWIGVLCVHYVTTCITLLRESLRKFIPLGVNVSSSVTQEYSETSLGFLWLSLVVSEPN